MSALQTLPQQGTCKFLSLPTELSDQIYELVLPSKPIRPRAGGTRREISASINFLFACKQIYREALAILYAKGEFLINIRMDGNYGFDGRRIAQDLDFSSQNPYRHIRNLNLDIVWNPKENVIRFGRVGIEMAAKDLENNIDAMCKALLSLRHLELLSVIFHTGDWTTTPHPFHLRRFFKYFEIFERSNAEDMKRTLTLGVSK